MKETGEDGEEEGDDSARGGESRLFFEIDDIEEARVKFVNGSFMGFC